jgi:hypothetical protein
MKGKYAFWGGEKGGIERLRGLDEPVGKLLVFFGFLGTRG